MATPVCTIDESGIHRPAFTDVLAYLKAQYQGIYGSDVYLEPDSQDGQLLGILAAAINDTNAQTVAAYNSFSPATAQGVGLSSVVKINGISRKSASNSTVDLTIIGQAGAVITNGVAGDQNSNQWVLPPTVIVPLSGQIIVTATAAQLGDVTAPAESITSILTPTRGWQSVTNINPATPGQPIETDATLRQRQATSTNIPASTVLGGMIGQIASIPDVVRYQAYENDTAVTDANGLPPNSIALVVDGGDATAIAQAIALRKSLGAVTYGTTQETVVDVYGIPHAVSFFRPTIVPITYGLTLKARRGFTVDIQAQVQQAISDWTNALGIGNSLYLTRSYIPANLSGGAGANTFEVLSLTAARDGQPLAAADVALAFNEAASCDPSNITVTVVT